MTRDLYCQDCGATFANMGDNELPFCNKQLRDDGTAVENTCNIITTRSENMKLLRNKENVGTSDLMTKLPNQEPVPPEVAKFAPKRERDQHDQEYLTADMVQPDPMRLTQMTAPAVEQIGIATATQIDAVANLIVEHAKAGAKALVDDAHRQAEKMVKDAEDIALRMMEFSTDVRTYSMAKSAQVSKFCSVAESVMGSMYALGDHFVANRREEVEQARAVEEPLEPPSFLRRPER